MSDRTTIGNVVYESIGSSNANLLLKCNGTARIQWGNKLIDLIKNGKLATSSIDNIFVVSSKSEIKYDGLYIVNENDSLQFIIKRNGETYAITDSDLYISASNKQQITVEQQKQALENLGLYYNTLEDVSNANIQNGLVFVLEDSSIYIIQNGVITSLTDMFQLATVSNYKERDNEVSELGQTSHFNTNSFLSGMIVMYYNTETIPHGWGVCDGRIYEYEGKTITTPDLTDKFIIASEKSNIKQQSNSYEETHESMLDDILSNYSLIFIMKL